jgi:DAACS family dicarboxylate/amino acid:cation (Na+ or H+) symporter
VAVTDRAAPPLSPAGGEQGEGASSSHRPLLFALLAGAGLGALANALGERLPWLEPFVAGVTQPAGQLFVRVLVVAVIPLAVGSLVLSLADLDPRALGRLGARVLAFTVGSSAIAALIGLLLVTVVGPGRGVGPALRATAGALREAGSHVQPPPSPGPARTVIPIATLLAATVATGLALGRARGPGAARVRAAVERLHALSTRAAALLMRIAPVGVAALLFTLTARLGGGAVRPLLAYVAVVVGGLLLHGGVVYALAVRFLGGMRPRDFFRGAQDAMATAFSTASSAATLPTALRVAEEELRVPPAVARLVLTAGSAMNQNGTSLFEGVTVLFLAQAYGVELSLLQQAGVMVIAVLAGIGSAGVPGGGGVAIAVILGLFGIPIEGVGLILGIDRFLDMCRTTVNVTGDLALAVVVSRGERASPQ